MSIVVLSTPPSSPGGNSGAGAVIQNALQAQLFYMYGDGMDSTLSPGLVNTYKWDTVILEYFAYPAKDELLAKAKDAAKRKCNKNQQSWSHQDEVNYGWEGVGMLGDLNIVSILTGHSLHRKGRYDVWSADCCKTFYVRIDIDFKGLDIYQFKVNHNDPWCKKFSESFFDVMTELANLWVDSKPYKIKWEFSHQFGYNF